MAIIELQLCDEDRERFGGPDWMPLDVDRLWSTPSERIERWEEEVGGYSISRAVLECSAGRYAPALPKRVLVWLARKQAPGRPYVDKDGNPEPFTALAEIQSHRVAFRSPKAADADPPEEPAPSQP